MDNCKAIKIRKNAGKNLISNCVSAELKCGKAVLTPRNWWAAAPRKKAKEEDVKAKVEEPEDTQVLERPPDDFVFNSYMGGQEHFDEFKLHVIGGSKRGTSINMEGIARMAAANSSVKKYDSKVWEEVDIKRIECNLVKDVIG